MAGTRAMDLITETWMDIHLSDTLQSIVMAPGQVMALCPEKENNDSWVKESPPMCRMPRRVLDQKLKARAMKLFKVFQGFKDLGDFDVNAGAAQLIHDPVAFCRSLNGGGKESRVVIWHWEVDTRRTVMVPPGYCLLVMAHKNFRADIRRTDGDLVETLGYEEALPMESGMFFAIFSPSGNPVLSSMGSPSVSGCLKTAIPENSHRPFYIWHTPGPSPFSPIFPGKKLWPIPSLKFLDVNGRGAMLRASAWWGRLESRYDGLLCANLNPDFPENRWMLLSRYRIWAVYQGYSRELTLDCLETFSCAHDGGGGTLAV